MDKVYPGDSGSDRLRWGRRFWALQVKQEQLGGWGMGCRAPKQTAGREGLGSQLWGSRVQDPCLELGGWVAT